MLRMNFLTLFDKYDWGSGTWVIHTARECWAILSVDSSGNTLPETCHYVRRAESSIFEIKFQSPEQRAKWQKLDGGFYDRIMKRAKDYENTFSVENIDRINRYLTELPDYTALVQDSKIPQNTFISTVQPHHHIDEQLDGLRIAEYMLHLDEGDALLFIENLTIHWAAQLPLVAASDAALERGRYLYLLAEEME